MARFLVKSCSSMQPDFKVYVAYASSANYNVLGEVTEIITCSFQV